MGANGAHSHSKAGGTQNAQNNTNGALYTAIQSPSAKASAQILRINPSEAAIKADPATRKTFSSDTGILFETPAQLQIKFIGTATNHGSVQAW
jgi:hypothetical protein